MNKDIAHRLNKIAHQLEAAEGMSATQFCEELRAQIEPKIGEKIFRCSGSGSQVLVNFYNVDRSLSRGGGGAVAENNRLMITVRGFGSDGGPPPNGKVQMKIVIWSFDYRQPGLKSPRGATLAPNKIVGKIVKTISDIMKLEPSL